MAISIKYAAAASSKKNLPAVGRCTRNIELQWLMQNLTPNYHTISDFRKIHAAPLQAMFKLYVQFMADAGLLGKIIIAVDGSKFKAVNGKKSNYNQKKIDKYRQFIENKTGKYLQELDELDKEKQNPDTDELNIKKEKITERLKKLKERTIKYDTLQQRLAATDDKQISTTDTDSRSILVTKAIVEVAYNVQNAVDDKHNLIVQTQATNTNLPAGKQATVKLYTKQPYMQNKIYNCKKKTASCC